MAVIVSGEGTETLPCDETNIVVRSMDRLFQRIGRPLPPVRLYQENHIPLTRGLGSSSAAIVAGLVGANALAGNPLDTDALVALATTLDGHPDNVTPCLVGGLTVTTLEGDRVHYARLPVPDTLKAVLYIPEFEMSTPTSRRQLPEYYSRADTVFALSRAALTAAAFATSHWELLRVGMQDRIHQPYRAQVFPQMSHLIAAALEAGAQGAALSGSGPTVIAFSSGDHEAVSRALAEAGDACGLRGDTRIVGVACEGASVERL